MIRRVSKRYTTYLNEAQKVAAPVQMHEQRVRWATP